MKRIAKFHKVSWEQFREGLGRYLRGTAGRKDPGNI